MSNPTHLNDFVGNPIHVGSKVVYIGFYSSGGLTTGVVTTINYDTDEVVVYE